MKSTRPEVRLFNRQKRLPVDLRGLREFLEQLSEELSLDRGFSVVLISDRAMKKLNRHFAGKNVSTDVLSFPASEREGQEDNYLGDILVSAETAQRQARGSLGDELKVLSLHGLLHLLGYDHEVDDGEMFRKEAELRRRFDLVC